MHVTLQEQILEGKQMKDVVSDCGLQYNLFPISKQVNQQCFLIMLMGKCQLGCIRFPSKCAVAKLTRNYFSFLCLDIIILLLLLLLHSISPSLPSVFPIVDHRYLIVNRMSVSQLLPLMGRQYFCLSVFKKKRKTHLSLSLSAAFFSG